jgi:hypothetical protein
MAAPNILNLLIPAAVIDRASHCKPEYTIEARFATAIIARTIARAHRFDALYS